MFPVTVLLFPGHGPIETSSMGFDNSCHSRYREVRIYIFQRWWLCKLEDYRSEVACPAGAAEVTVLARECRVLDMLFGVRSHTCLPLPEGQNGSKNGLNPIAGLDAMIEADWKVAQFCDEYIDRWKEIWEILDE